MGRGGYVGVLALQGDFEAHGEALAKAGEEWRPVRTAEDVRHADALVLPGGESSANLKLMEGTGIAEAIREAAETKPVLATCAGTILLAREVRNPPQAGLGLLDAVAVRNAYGRQLDSSVQRLTELDSVALGGEPLEAVFIRAPKLEELGAGVNVLARRDGDPVLVRDRNVLAATFHPELGRDPRVLALFRAMIETARRNGHGGEAEQAGVREGSGR